jgi:hypothetical protein
VAFFMRYYKPNENTLIWYKRFEDHNDLFGFDIHILSDAIRQLEIHTDINISYSQITYLADVGIGPSLPLMAINRLPLGRGISFADRRAKFSISIHSIGGF